MAVIRQQTQVFNKPVGVRRINTGEAELWETIKAEADEFTRRAYNDAAEKAQTTGAETALGVDLEGITTIDPLTGKPKAIVAPKGMGSIAQKAYQNVITQRYEDSIKDEMSIRAAEIALKYQYKPEEYATAMSQHIAAMSENADGMYASFIRDYGGKQLASNKLSLQTELREKVRTDAGNSIILKGKASVQSITDLGFARNIVDMEELIAENVANYKNGETADLIKAGSAEAAQTTFEVAGVNGFVNSLLNTTQNPVQRSAIITYLDTGGVVSESLDPVTKVELDKIKDYLDVNTIDAITTSASAQARVMDSTYNKVLTQQNAEDSALGEIKKAKMKKMLISNDTLFSDTIVDVSRDIQKIVNSIGDLEVDERFGRYDGTTLDSIKKPIEAITEHYTDQAKFLKERRTNNSANYTKTMYESDLKDLKEALMKPLLRKIAKISEQEGNTDYVTDSIINGDIDSLQKLTPIQQILVQTIRSTPVYNPNDDSTYIKGVIKDSINLTEAKITEEKEKLLVLDYVQKHSSNAGNNALSDEALNSINQNLKGRIGKHGYTSANYQRDKKQIEGNAAAGIMREFGAYASSEQFLALIQFVATATGPNKVGDIRGMTNSNGTVRQSEVRQAKRILDLLGDNDPKEFIRVAEDIKINIKNREDKQVKANENIAFKQSIIDGTAIRTATKTQKGVDGIFTDAGIDIGKWNTYDENTQRLMFQQLVKAPSFQMVNALKQIASGVGHANDKAYLDLYIELDNYMDGDANRSSRLSDVMSATELSRLDHIHRTLQHNPDVTVNQIAAKFSDLERSGKVAEIQERLGGITVNKFLSDITKDPLLTTDLMPVVKFAMLRGDSPDMVKGFIEDYMDKKYLTSEFVLDPRAPNGEFTKSQYSLESTFPDLGEKHAFLFEVEKYLKTISIPQGKNSVGKPQDNLEFSMYADKSRRASSSFKELGTTANDRTKLVKGLEEKTQVFLIPDLSSSGVTYLVYYKAEDGIKPIITEDADGNPFIPRFSSDDTKQYRIDNAVEEELNQAIAVAGEQAKADKKQTLAEKIKVEGPMAKPQR
tara:strand:- start:43 stop:3213 length:3171 start_codon:yes stop_codon:yes gene_type:complete